MEMVCALGTFGLVLYKKGRGIEEENEEEQVEEETKEGWKQLNPDVSFLIV
jgi:hypothetical protein